MAIKRDIHISRTIDMMFGAFISDKSSPVEVLTKEMQALVKEINSAGARYRTILTQNTPAIYVVDCQDIARVLKKELSKTKSTETFGNTVKNQLDAEFGGLSRIKEFIKPDGIDLIDSIVNQNGFENELAEALYKAFSTGGTVLSRVQSTKQTMFGVVVEINFEKTSTFKPIPIDSLSKLQAKLSGTYLKYRSSVAAEMRQASTNYTKIQALGVKLGKDCSDILKGFSNFIAKDGNTLIALPSDKSLVVCGPSFDGVVTAVNRVLDNAFKNFLFEKSTEALQYLKDYSDKGKDNKYFSIGFLINAGHTSASALLSGGKRVLGVNMPSAQQAQITLTRAQAQSLEDELADVYADIDYDVKFKTQYRKAKVLMELNFAFVISMPAALNTKSLNTVERAVIKKHIQNVEKSFQQFVTRKNVANIAAEYLPISSSSPSLVDNIRDDIISMLKGENGITRSSEYKTSKKSSFGKPGRKTPIIQKPKASTKKVKGKTTNKVPKVRITKLLEDTSSVTNLRDLLAKINSMLQQRVRQNMGTGNRRDVLNYRTGRFAESVNVERLTQGREGTITAYYNYMKYPYATFSTGGRQEFPRSRDPKLLISKSIREIMQEQMITRMRAVLV